MLFAPFMKAQHFGGALGQVRSNNFSQPPWTLREHKLALAVVNGWMASTGHCNNIMNGVLRDIGVAYYPGGTYGHYWTQDFGKQ